jgi:hypothetical protein
MVVDWDCIVRNWLRVADGPVKPDYDGDQESALPTPRIICVYLCASVVEDSFTDSVAAGNAE